MSQSDNSDKKKDGYFYIDTDSLRVDEKLTFDCFIHLEENNKVVHWMREGAVLTRTRKDKLLRFGSPPVMVMTTHRLKYMQYISDKTALADPEAKLGKTVVQAPAKEEVVFGETKIAAPKPAPANLPKASLQARIGADFLNAVIKTTVDVFSQNFHAPISFKPAIARKENSKPNFEVDVASFIGLTSESIRGTIGLCFPTETYRYLLCQATHEFYESVTSDLYVGCGEFMYVIYETARPRLAELGYVIDRAIPTLSVGKNMPITHLIPDRGFSLAFECSGGPFSFEIGIKTGT